MNIGILEDNPAILDYMTIALEMAGHRVQTFTSSTPLIGKLLANSEIHDPLPYDLIVVDLLLPGSISGFEAIKHIQRSIPLSRLPIIIITAGVKEELEHVQAALPEVPILRKPFKMSELLRLIDNLQAA